MPVDNSQSLERNVQIKEGYTIDGFMKRNLENRTLINMVLSKGTLVVVF